MKTLQHLIPNHDGWLLSLYQTWDESRLDRARKPVLIVPGYGMNSFIFSYHPQGLSLEGYLAQQGFEVWRVDLRGQGGAVRRGGGDSYSIEDLAIVDLGCAIDAALERTRTQASRLDMIGASLGGTFMFAQVALNPRHRLDSLVALGSPIRWVDAPMILRAALALPMLVGLIKVRGTRKFAETVTPHLAKHLPWLLSVYMNPEITDASAISEMVKTVEDPNRHINREIAHWVRGKDLILSSGVNLSESLERVTNPHLCVLALGDGIVPPRTARYSYERVASPVKALVEVGTSEIAMAHADLFVSSECHERVFAPVADWLAQPAVEREQITEAC